VKLDSVKLDSVKLTLMANPKERLVVFEMVVPMATLLEVQKRTRKVYQMVSVTEHLTVRDLVDLLVTTLVSMMATSLVLLMDSNW
jgi:hypothetical protein